MKKKLPSYLPNMALKLAIDSYKSRTSILSKLEEYSPVKEILEILGGCKKLSKSIEYRSEMDELERAGLIECYNNHCTATPKGKDLYERFQNEKNIIEDILRDYYRIGIKNVDMKYITSRALDSLLEFVKTYGFPKPTRNTDPLAEILFINNPTKSFTPVILGTQYALPLLILYDYTLSCEINEKCKNHYPSGKTITRLLEDYELYKQKVSIIPLINSGLIEKVPYGNNKYKLTQLGTNVAKRSALQAYITFKI
jgi:predicted transcriptional regulator